MTHRAFLFMVSTPAAFAGVCNGFALRRVTSRDYCERDARRLRLTKVLFFRRFVVHTR